MGSKQLGSKFLKRSQICSQTPGALNAGAKRTGATCHMTMPQCCYLAKGAKRPSLTTNTIKFDRIPFDPCNSIKRFDLCPFAQKNSTYLQPPRLYSHLAKRSRTGAKTKRERRTTDFLGKKPYLNSLTKFKNAGAIDQNTVFK